MDIRWFKNPAQYQSRQFARDIDSLAAERNICRSLKNEAGYPGVFWLFWSLTIAVIAGRLFWQPWPRPTTTKSGMPIEHISAMD